MKSLRHIFLCSIFFFNNAPIASEVDNSYQKQSLLAVLYKRTSAEYKANTFQVYSSAKNNIDKAHNTFSSFLTEVSISLIIFLIL